MPYKVRPCKSCEGKRWGNSSWCKLHHFERLKKRKEETKQKRLERKLKSKKHQDNERRVLRNKLDAAFSKVIRLPGKCAKCGRGASEVALQCSHIYSRKHLSVRWDELNAKVLCAADHFWWHQNPAEAVAWLTESGTRTPEQMKELQQRANAVKHWTVPELKALLAELESKLL